ncbi:MAG: winged helix-turn-helix transcriptional regulator [Bacteroidetes bacterium]|nr:winged helix-turn-helix transcriptional regulator [Bacteroidota bacterium]
MHQAPLHNLDATDLRILRLLQHQAKVTNKEIAAELGLTASPVYERIRRLERTGVIRRYVALIDREQLGLRLLVFCNVSIKEHARPYILQFEREIQTLPEVLECFHTAGGFDYLLKIVVPDMNAYQQFLVQKLAALENIGRVQSSFVMDEIKHNTQIPI